MNPTLINRVWLLATLPAPWCASAQDTTPPPAPVNLRILQLGPTPNRVAIQWNSVVDAGPAGLKE